MLAPKDTTAHPPASEQCSLDLGSKVDCGWVSITEDACRKRGCCYHPVPTGPWCYLTSVQGYDWTDADWYLLHRGSTPRAVCEIPRQDGYLYYATKHFAGDPHCPGPFLCCRRHLPGYVAVAKGLAPGADSGPTGRQCGAFGRTAQPSSNMQLHFLFSIDGDLPHADVWKAFFSSAPPGSWLAWAHCRDALKCADRLAASGLQSFSMVPTVVDEGGLSPMIALLQQAVQYMAYAGEVGGDVKFIFVSPFALPVKPFNVIARDLSKYPESSDFCIDADLPESRPELGMHWKALPTGAKVVKASPWSVISLKDANTLLGNVKSPPTAHHPVTFRKSDAAATPEEAIFANVFGALGAAGDGAAPTFPGVGPIHGQPPRAARVQGCCRTWSLKSHSQVAAATQAELLREVLSDPQSVVRVGDDYVWHVVKLSSRGLTAFRKSSYFFAAHVWPDVTKDFADAMFRE